MAGKSKRGFASMDPQRQREIASKGGRAAHAKGTAHEWSSEEARVAGRKGGEVVSRDRDHMAAIGREGGESRGARARQAAQLRQQHGGELAAAASQPHDRAQQANVERDLPGGGYLERESPLGVSREGTPREEAFARGDQESGGGLYESVQDNRPRSAEQGTTTEDRTNTTSPL